LFIEKIILDYTPGKIIQFIGATSFFLKKEQNELKKKKNAE